MSRLRLHRLSLLLVLATVSASPGRADDSADIVRPRPSFLRYTEDWSGLRGATESQLTDAWDSWKLVELGGPGGAWASFGGHVRLRGESWTNFRFGGPPDDDEFLLARAALHGDFHFNEHVRAFLEVGSAVSTDRDLPGGERASDVDSLDLNHAFLDLVVPAGERSSVTFRAGRQTFFFKKRLLHAAKWPNVGRRWDGLSVIGRTGPWTVHAFASQFVPTRKHDFNEPDSGHELGGVYVLRKPGKTPSRVSLDAYYLRLARDSASFNGTSGDDLRHTVGTRIGGRFGASPATWDVELAYQFGSVGAEDVSAYMVASEFAVPFPRAAGKPALLFGLDHASGDDEPGGSVQTFNPLFPVGHGYLGQADIVGRKNSTGLVTGVLFKPRRDLKVKLAAHAFWRADEDDAAYAPSQRVVRAPGGSTETEIGQELDLTVTWSPSRHVMLQLGYSHFFAGEFLEETGAHEDVDFAFLEVTYLF